MLSYQSIYSFYSLMIAAVSKLSFFHRFFQEYLFYLGFDALCWFCCKILIQITHLGN